MKSYTFSAVGIAFKIWLIAVLINTVADTLILSGFMGEFIFTAMLIAVFSGLFSLPVFLLLWGIIYNEIFSGKRATYILKTLLLSGAVLATIAWLVFAAVFHLFSEKEFFYPAIVAPLSGAAAICIVYPFIKKTCAARDEARILLEKFAADT